MTGNRRASDRGSLVMTRGLMVVPFFEQRSGTLNSSSDDVGVNGKLAECKGETPGDRGAAGVDIGGNGNLKE